MCSLQPCPRAGSSPCWEAGEARAVRDGATPAMPLAWGPAPYPEAEPLRWYPSPLLQPLALPHFLCASTPTWQRAPRSDSPSLGPPPTSAHPVSFHLSPVWPALTPAWVSCSSPPLPCPVFLHLSLSPSPFLLCLKPCSHSSPAFSLHPCHFLLSVCFCLFPSPSLPLVSSPSLAVPPGHSLCNSVLQAPDHPPVAVGSLLPVCEARATWGYLSASLPIPSPHSPSPLPPQPLFYHTQGSEGLSF